MIVVIILSIAIVTLQKGQVTGYEYKRPVEANSFKIAEDVWLNQLHILNKRDGAHAHEHTDSGYGAPPTTYEEPAASYGAPAPNYAEPAMGYGAPAPAYGYRRRSAEAEPEDEANDGAHGHEHADSGFGAPPATYDEPAASYGAPAPTYKEPASRYDTARGFAKRSAEASSFKIAEDVWLNQLHILTKREGAHAHEHTDSGYGAPPATYEKPAASYGAPAPNLEEPASGY